MDLLDLAVAALQHSPQIVVLEQAAQSLALAAGVVAEELLLTLHVPRRQHSVPSPAMVGDVLLWFVFLYFQHILQIYF